METLFFLLLFARNCRFQRCSNSKLSLSIPSVVQNKKVGRDVNTHLCRRFYVHAKPLHRVPVISSPNPFFDRLWRSTVRLQRSLAEVHTMESFLSTAECRKSTKNSSQASRLGPLRAAKKQKNHQDFDADWPATSKDTFFFNFGGRLLDRWCSSSLALFSSAIYSRQGDFATCFTCLQQSTWPGIVTGPRSPHLSAYLHMLHSHVARKLRGC